MSTEHAHSLVGECQEALEKMERGKTDHYSVSLTLETPSETAEDVKSCIENNKAYQRTYKRYLAMISADSPNEEDAKMAQLWLDATRFELERKLTMKMEDAGVEDYEAVHIVRVWCAEHIYHEFFDSVPVWARVSTFNEVEHALIWLAASEAARVRRRLWVAVAHKEGAVQQLAPRIS